MSLHLDRLLRKAELRRNFLLRQTFDLPQEYDFAAAARQSIDRIEEEENFLASADCLANILFF